jgi:hypothetical protein
MGTMKGNFIPDRVLLIADYATAVYRLEPLFLCALTKRVSLLSAN